MSTTVVQGAVRSRLQAPTVRLHHSERMTEAADQGITVRDGFAHRPAEEWTPSVHDASGDYAPEVGAQVVRGGAVPGGGHVRADPGPLNMAWRG